MKVNWLKCVVGNFSIFHFRPTHCTEVLGYYGNVWYRNLALGLGLFLGGWIWASSSSLEMLRSGFRILPNFQMWNLGYQNWFNFNNTSRSQKPIFIKNRYFQITFTRQKAVLDETNRHKIFVFLENVNKMLLIQLFKIYNLRVKVKSIWALEESLCQKRAFYGPFSVQIGWWVLICPSKKDSAMWLTLIFKHTMHTGIMKPDFKEIPKITCGCWDIHYLVQFHG